MEINKLPYRPEVDGLRAISVMAVIIYHSGLGLLPGGLFGVDVFFVISGYLITSLILHEKKLGKFSIARFYERRARRILPALFLVMFCCLPFAWYWMLPAEFYRFSQSLIGIVLFYSNVLFYQTTNYFVGTELLPLVHTWSLAVEEQFYLFFPVVMALTWRWGLRKVFWVTVALMLSSLAIYIFWYKYPEYGSSFYLAPARVWQILAGSVVAMLPFSFSRKANEAVSLIGILSILSSFFLYGSGSREPGFLALLPTAGAALVIATAGVHNWTGRILAHPWLVLIGLCSFSAYLWHQPLFAFTRMFTILNPSALVSSVVIFTTLILAYLSYKFIETPFRNRDRIGRSKIIAFGILGTIFFASAGWFGINFTNHQDRIGSQVFQIMGIPDITSAKCHARLSGALIESGSYCLLGKPNVAPSFAIIGDSHAGSLVHALKEQAIAKSLSFLVISEGWCVPFLDFGNNSHPPCRSLMNQAFKQISKFDSITSIVLSAEWANYTQGYRIGSKPIAYQDDESKEISLKQNPEVFERGLRRTLDFLKLHKKKVFLVGPIPEQSFDVKVALARSVIFDRSPYLLKPITLNEYRSRNNAVILALNKFVNEVFIVDPSRIFCSEAENICPYVDAAGNSLYSDGNHPSLLGARLIVRRLFN